jgi:hypothetical protein
MNRATQLEYRAGSRLGKHEGEPSFALCDRLDRTRANSQRQLPTDHDYAVPTREYQTDQSSLITAQTAARSVLVKRQKQLQEQPHRICSVDRVTPYQGNALIEPDGLRSLQVSGGLWTARNLSVRSQSAEIPATDIRSLGNVDARHHNPYALLLPLIYNPVAYCLFPAFLFPRKKLLAGQAALGRTLTS